MIKKILLSVAGVLAVLVLGFVLVAAMQPADFRMSRSAKMTAPPAKVFAEVNDFHNWEAWSPWAKLDPNCKVEYSGPTAGVGASFAWSGNDKVGAGRQTITESREGELVLIKLNFEKPFKATNTAEFTFKPEGEQTLVTWSMFGKNNFMGKAISLIMDCDKIVGPDFEKGLASLKTVVESPDDKSEGQKTDQAPIAKTE